MATRIKTELFQLGHVFSDMEILFSGNCGPCQEIHVSIGPRLFRHGNENKLRYKAPLGAGFNWATSFQTWKYLFNGTVFANGPLFQLGHVFSDMEINFRKNQGGINNAFQLGHVFSDMEIDTNNRGVW